MPHKPMKHISPNISLLPKLLRKTKPLELIMQELQTDLTTEPGEKLLHGQWVPKTGCTM